MSRARIATRSPRLLVLLLALLAALVLAAPSAAAPRPPRTFVPIGSDYQPATLQRFARAAVAHDASGTVDLLVLPITFATDAYSITVEERAENRRSSR